MSLGNTKTSDKKQMKEQEVSTENYNCDNYNLNMFSNQTSEDRIQSILATAFNVLFDSNITSPCHVI